MTSKFEGKETTVKGFFVDKVNGQSTPFEMVVSYARSLDKATKNVIANLSDEEKAQYIVAVTSFENEKAIPKRYNQSKVYELAEFVTDNENETHDGLKRITVTLYMVSGMVWSIDNEDNYHMHKYNDETPLNMTKTEQRAFIRMEYERMTGETVLAMHDVNKNEFKVYCFITPDALAKCELEK